MGVASVRRAGIAMLLLAAAAAAPAEELPVEYFFRNPEFSSLQISPDGRYLGAIVPVGGHRNLAVLDLENMQARAVTTLTRTDVDGYQWASAERLLFFLDSDGNEAFGIYAVSRDGSKPRALVEPGEGITVVPRQATVIDRLRDDPDHVLITYNERRRLEPDVFRLNVWTGRMKRVARNPGKVVGWLPDQAGRVRVAIATTDDLVTRILYRAEEDADWQTLAEFPWLAHGWRPLALDHDGRTLYVASTMGRDTAALQVYDLRERRLGAVLFAPDGVDLSGFWYSRHRHLPVAALYSDDRPRIHYLDREFAGLQAAIDRVLPETLNRVVNMSDDEQRLVVLATSDRHRGTYYLLDRKAAKLRKLVDVADWIRPADMVEVRPIRYRSRDGLTIHGYLTLPKDREAKDLPLIVHPHGGPYGVRDQWGFNPELQFLANRGYAVLQMNYRGSGGYGKTFQEAGYRKWGLEMQDDITDGVRWAIDQGIADPDRVCIYGASYGGYAAMAGVTLTPELYACGIDYVGVVDLEMLYKWDARATRYGAAYLENWFKRAVGDIHDPEDLERLRATSPIRHVERIRAPLLVVHGARDRRVEIKQARVLLKALERHDKPHVSLIAPDEGHGFRGEANRLELYETMDGFLKQHL